MDAQAREQYLADLRLDYEGSTRKEKARILDEAEKRTHLNRKVLIRKLRRKPKAKPVRRRKPVYGLEVKAALTYLWNLFDCPCGQRMTAVLREQVPRLRQAGEWQCPEEIAVKLLRISAKTIGRLLRAERRKLRCIGGGLRPLLRAIPVKLSTEWDRQQLGNLQLDYVLHCGSSSAGSFLRTLSAVDVASGWWEGEAIQDALQASTVSALQRIRQRLPFALREIHPV